MSEHVFYSWESTCDCVKIKTTSFDFILFVTPNNDNRTY